MRRAAAVAALLLGGCASSSLVLLPDEGGGSGQVAVLESGGRQQENVIAQANSRTSLTRRGGRTRGFEQLSERDRAVVGDLPPPPRTFVLNFDEAQTQITRDSEGELAALFAEVAGREGAEVQVTGYTDTVGNDEDNDRLSSDRARRIRDALVARGLPVDITSVVGRGERDLRVKTADNVEEPRNRRVEVIVR